MPRIALQVHPSDNVVTLIDSLIDETRTRCGLTLRGPIAFGHKAASQDIAEGEPVIKYGVVIGLATRSIATGEHVHVHNCR
ncbi:MAG: UxaA family hydrolase [Betaproteobacteria bacterium]|nr:UxaA family hydrolase [Betaproteobacteria bacterium]